MNLAGLATTQKNRNGASTLAHENHYTSEKFLNGVRLENLLRHCFRSAGKSFLELAKGFEPLTL